MTFKNVQSNKFSWIKDYSSFKNDQDTCTNKISVVLGNMFQDIAQMTYTSVWLDYPLQYWRILGRRFILH